MANINFLQHLLISITPKFYLGDCTKVEVGVAFLPPMISVELLHGLFVSVSVSILSSSRPPSASLPDAAATDGHIHGQPYR